MSAATPQATPTVSVVIATYNRSQVLKYAIRSVLASTFCDYELIVVGDACTDDTEACVASFGDPRLRFVNLPRNCGDQSGPNNRGIELARGRYLAFLNHDDLYLPDHLATAVAALNAGKADLIWVPCAEAQDPAVPGPDGLPCRFLLTGGPSPCGYSPFQFYLASTWVLRSELAARVGPWPSHQQVWVTPSQAWLFRAFRAGASLEFVPHVGVVAIHSSWRRGSYATRHSPEHERIERWMRTDPRFRERLYEHAAVGTLERRVAIDVYHAPLPVLAQGCLRPVYALLMACGVHPRSLNQALRYGRRGGFIRYHRRFTGIR